MFYVTYMLDELRRRRGRTLLTALGLAVGVGLVVTVNALSTGLDTPRRGARAAHRRRHRHVRDPAASSSTRTRRRGPRSAACSEEERGQLREENGGGTLRPAGLGEPGETFSRDEFVAAAQLELPGLPGHEDRRRSTGVAAADGGLTLNAIHVEGTVPEPAEQARQRRPRRARSRAAGPPENIDFTSISVTGIDPAQQRARARLGRQVTAGRFLSDGARARRSLNVAYASRKGLGVGDTITARRQDATRSSASRRRRSAGPPRTSTCRSSSCRRSPAARAASTPSRACRDRR